MKAGRRPSQLPVTSILHIDSHSRLTNLLGHRVFALEQPVILTIAKWPPRASRRDWLLAIHRRCKQAKLPLAIVNTNGSLARRARTLNIPVFDTMEEAVQHLAGAKPSPVLASRERMQDRLEVPAHVSTKSFKPGRRSWLSMAASLILLIASVGTVLVFATLVMPSAIVTVYPPIHRLDVKVPMTASLGVDRPDNDIGLVPGRYVISALEISRTGPTTAKKLLPTEKATGVLLAVNQTQAPVAVPAGTIVQTGTGQAIRFVTTENVTVPGSSQFQQPIPIESLEPGKTGNVPPNSITNIAGPFTFQLWITNPQPTSGGTSELLSVVSQADIDRLRAQLLAEAESSAHQILAEELEDTEWLPPAGLNVDLQWASTDFFVAEETEELTMIMMVNISGIAVNTTDMVEYVMSRVARQTPADGLLLPASLDLALQPNPQWTGAILVFSVSAAADYVLEVREDQLRQAIAGLTPDEAMAQLAAWSSSEPPTVELYPPTQEVLPLLARRIRVRTHVPT